MKIINECRLDFSYRLSSDRSMERKTIFSNLVSTQIIKDILRLDKYVDRKKTYSFDILTYTIVISNISNTRVEKIFFKDYIPKGTKFIRNSLIINDIKRRCENPEEGVYLGDLISGFKVKISFKVIVLKQYGERLIENYSVAEYDYIYNVELLPIRIFKESNKVISLYENKIFKQTSIINTLKTYYDIDNILSIKCETEIIKTKCINSYEVGQCKLLIIGKIKYEMKYMSGRYIRFVKDIFGFSTCMLMPKGVTYLNKVVIKVNSEYLYINFINKNTLAINNVLMLYY